jgi:hypothetical protein
MKIIFLTTSVFMSVLVIVLTFMGIKFEWSLIILNIMCLGFYSILRDIEVSSEKEDKTFTKSEILKESDLNKLSEEAENIYQQEINSLSNAPSVFRSEIAFQCTGFRHGYKKALQSGLVNVKRDIKMGEVFSIEGKKYIVVPPTSDSQMALMNGHRQVLLELTEVE